MECTRGQNHGCHGNNTSVGSNAVALSHSIDTHTLTPCIHHGDGVQLVSDSGCACVCVVILRGKKGSHTSYYSTVQVQPLKYVQSCIPTYMDVHCTRNAMPNDITK